MLKPGDDDASLLTPAEAAQLAPLGPRALAFAIAVRKRFPGAKLSVRTPSDDPDFKKRNVP
jgi:hypothetical protein